MKIVACNLDLVSVSTIDPGGAFRWGNKHYIRTCRALCERGIWGVNLVDGCYISEGNVLVTLVDMEATVL